MLIRDAYWRTRASEMLLELLKHPYGRARVMQLAIKLYGDKRNTVAYDVLKRLQKAGYVERVAMGVYQLTELGKETAKGLVE
jgi:Mn-dependent DtxR family transcriptional regulator